MRRIMGQKNQGIFSIEKEFAINRDKLELTMTLMRLITIKYFNRLTALNKTQI
jgi:hypothetical protein